MIRVYLNPKSLNHKHMTITQLEYIVAVDTYKSFGKAAVKCSVTQPSLSMQVQKLEEELGIKIFDRSKKPVTPTETGKAIITQARTTLQESTKIHEIVSENTDKIVGTVRLGVIPTLAPYLLPLFLVKFLEKYPDVRISVSETTTERIVAQLKNNLLDIGLLATPLDEKNIREIPLFYEPFVSYLSEQHKLASKTTVTPQELEKEDLWLLTEGHCLRSQIINICQKSGKGLPNLEYQTGSVETLKRIVEMTGGITILPELSIFEFSGEQIDRVRYFNEPEPVREISLITHQHFIKSKLIKAISDEIIANIPKKMRIKENKRVVQI